MSDLPVVPLPGSEDWAWGFEWGWGQRIEEAFPGQDGADFASAVAHNDAGPSEDQPITGLVMLQQGERDERAWIWRVSLADGSVWLATGSCDYTGWDCQSSLDWEPSA